MYGTFMKQDIKDKYSYTNVCKIVTFYLKTQIPGNKGRTTYSNVYSGIAFPSIFDIYK